MDCFGTYFTHVQTCDNVRVQTARQWTASAHTAHMSKPVITFVFNLLRNGLLRHILHTYPHLVITFVFQVLCNGLLRYILHTCPNQSATQWCGFVRAWEINGKIRKKQLINSQRDDPHSFLQKLAVSFDVVKK